MALINDIMNEGNLKLLMDDETESEQMLMKHSEDSLQLQKEESCDQLIAPDDEDIFAQAPRGPRDLTIVQEDDDYDEEVEVVGQGSARVKPLVLDDEEPLTNAPRPTRLSQKETFDYNKVKSEPRKSEQRGPRRPLVI